MIMAIQTLTVGIILLSVMNYCLCNKLSCCKHNDKHNDSILDCSNCQLTRLPMELMNNRTTHLYLNDNDINEIPTSSFANMTSLKTLQIMNNPLRQLYDQSLAGKFHTIHILYVILFALQSDNI